MGAPLDFVIQFFLAFFDIQVTSVYIIYSI